LQSNRVKRLYDAGRCAYGTYINLPTAMSVEIAALAGFDFVRIDAYHSSMNPETMQAMVTTAYSYDITPWVRCPNDALTIENLLDLGVQMLSIPNMPNAAAAREAVARVFYPPQGTREMSMPLRFQGLSMSEYLDWVRQNVVLSCQIEGPEGLENYREIVRVEGLGCIQTGRADISLCLGLPGEEFHPRVLEWEERIVTAALEAGKQVSLVHAMTEDGMSRTLKWIERGVRIATMDTDHKVLRRHYSDGLTHLRQSARA
jgi:4-hydroxy-2-oxoheptanedioate aldolase